MALIVQKYGGTSLADPERIKAIARRVVEEHRKGHQLVVVVSAMGDTTDRLVELAHQVSKNPPRREMDMLLSVGERISIALLAMAISDLGVQAISFTGSQVGIITDTRHTEARILEVRAHRIREELDRGKIVIVAGFQGVSINKEITTLGRGGSDTTAVALAAALQADRCELMKDVDGIFVAEPRLVPNVQLNPRLSYDEMIEMANLGAGVLKTESVEVAKHYRVKVAVGNSFTGRIGTIITDKSLDSSAVRGIVGQKELAWIRLPLPEPPAAHLHQLNQQLVEARVKMQHFSLTDGAVWLAFHRRFLPDFNRCLQASPLLSRLNLKPQVDETSGMVAIIGTGLNFNSETAGRVFQALENLSCPTENLQVSELKITFRLPASRVDPTIQFLYQQLLERTSCED
ncbi:MAG: aspartate kinase [Calditrichaeota bacterium]|nr:MAG: aspartate kinase [Calditrichota bacterium]